MVSPPKGADLSGYVGSTPTRSPTEKTFDLKRLFTYSEVRKAFSLLRRKNKYKPNNNGLLRNRFATFPESNALGRFLLEHDKDNAYRLYVRDFGVYKLSPYRGMAILKKNLKYRPLLVPIPSDRLVFLTALPRIRSILKTSLTRVSALGVGVNDDEADVVRKTMRNILADIDRGYVYVLALDFQDFFSSIDREILFRRLRPLFQRKSELPLFELVKESINAEIITDSLFDKEFSRLDLLRRGIPQGLAYSPLLASFFGTSIDDAVDRRSLKAYRYLDDMIILARSRPELMRVYGRIQRVASQKGLILHPLGTKTFIVNLKKKGSVATFLGIEISPKKLRIPEAAIIKMKEVISREILTKSHIRNNNHDTVKKVFRDYIKGWARYYSHVCPEDYKVNKPSIEDFIRELLLRKKWSKKLYESEESIFRLP